MKRFALLPVYQTFLSRRIQYFTAGQDGVITCRAEAELNAEAIGDDLEQHTFKWVQISGDPVTFLTPTNELTVRFTYDIKDDKKFRFYVDKDTPYEVYEDVWVWSTPTERHYHAARFSRPVSTLFGDGCRENQDVYLLTQLPDYETAMVGSASHTDNDKMLLWELPACDSQYVTHYIVQRWENGDWVDFQLLPKETRTVNIDNVYNYRLKTFFLFTPMYSGYYTTVSKTIKVTDEPETYGISAHENNARVLDYTHEFSGYSVLQRFLISLDADTSQAANINAHIPDHTQKWSNYSVLQRFVTTLAPTPVSESPTKDVKIVGYTHETTGYEVLELVNIEIGGDTTTTITIGG